MKKGKWMQALAVFMAAMLLAGCSSDEGGGDKKESETAKETEESTKTEETAETEKAADSAAQEELYKTQCQYMDYREFFRYEEKYKGTKVFVYLEVAQVMEDGLRCYSDSNGDGWYTDEEYYIEDDRVNKDLRILNDDIIVVWGEYTGSVKMTRAINNVKEDIVSISAKYIDLCDEYGNIISQFQEYDSYEDGGMDIQGWEEENSYVNGMYDADGYIIERSSYSWIAYEDLEGMTYQEARLALNEIYARHGRKFKDNVLQDYFDGKTWYYGIVEPDQFDESVFNDKERDNIEIIREYMESVKDGAPTGSGAVKLQPEWWFDASYAGTGDYSDYALHFYNDVVGIRKGDRELFRDDYYVVEEEGYIYITSGARTATFTWTDANTMVLEGDIETLPSGVVFVRD